MTLYPDPYVPTFRDPTVKMSQTTRNSIEEQIVGASPKLADADSSPQFNSWSNLYEYAHDLYYSSRIPHSPRLTSKIAIRAELARRGLLEVQLQSYDDPEFGWIIPKTDPEAIESVWEFIAWLEKQVAE